jgi:hypothetical protein
MEEKLDRVVCAALKCKATGRIVLGLRHWDVFMHQNMSQESVSTTANTEQGFVNQKGEFLTREEAWKVASDANQFINGRSQLPGFLFSEDIY